MTYKNNELKKNDIHGQNITTLKPLPHDKPTDTCYSNHLKAIILFSWPWEAKTVNKIWLIAQH